MSDTRFGRIKDYYENAENRTIPGLTSGLVKDDIAYLIEALEQAWAEIETLKTKVKELEDVAFRHGSMLDPPCFVCSYNSHGYFNPTIHPCAARHHNLYEAKP